MKWTKSCRRRHCEFASERDVYKQPSLQMTIAFTFTTVLPYFTTSERFVSTSEPLILIPRM